jgi:cytochrome b subunit of formate dehydrogenase
MSTPTRYRRFALSQQIEHVLLIATFATLAATGLPQKYAGAAWADGMIALFGGIDSARRIHHIAATLMMLEAVYHFAAVAYRVFVRRVRMTMLPTLQDVRDVGQAFLYNIGFAKTRPQMGRYTFEEKVEYWSLLWGTVVMIITGFLMWNPIAATRILPGQFIPAAKAAHGGEALLAVLAILLWHMYSVHLRRFNKSMWTGALSEDEMLHEHPLELADMKAGLAERPLDAVVLKKRRQIFVPVAGMTSALLLLGVYVFVTFEQTAIETQLPPPDVQVFAPQTPTPLPPTATPPPATPPAVGDLTWAGFTNVLLADKCAACHGTMAGLSFATYADALRGSQNGPVIVPGDAAGSRLVIVQSAGGHPGQLSAEELSRVKEWIDLGAPEN